MTTYEQITYQGWPDSHRLTNGIVDVVVSGGFGPRILRYGYVDERNEFLEAYDDARKQPDNEFKFYGGHRLWHAPEDPQRTYVPDNSPVAVKFAGGVLSVNQPAEPRAQIEKAIDIVLDATSTQVTLTHVLTNHSLWDVELAAWALTVFVPGGTALVPFPPRGSHSENLLPSNTLVMWAYTDFSDPRWSFGTTGVMLHANPELKSAQKIGASVPNGWLAYHRDGVTFVKRFEHQRHATYPDGGCSAEIFTNGLFIELESLSPVVCLSPGESVEHAETWELRRDLPEPSPTTITHISARIED